VFWESEIKLKKNRSVSEYYFNLMSGAKTHEASTLPFPSDWIILLVVNKNNEITREE